MPDEQSRVTAAVWPWRHESEVSAVSDPTVRRKRAVVESAVILIVGLLLAFVLHKPRLGCVVLCISGTVFVGGLFVPPVYYGFKRFGQWLARIVGVGLSWLLLLPFFYICFTCGRIFLMVMRKDILHRACPTGQESYWSPHRRNANLEQYRKQY